MKVKTSVPFSLIAFLLPVWLLVGLYMLDYMPTTESVAEYKQPETYIEIWIDKLDAQIQVLWFRVGELEKAIDSLIEQEREEPEIKEAGKERIIKSWQGAGTKTTEPFEIKGEMWCVRWENKGSFLQIYVYRTSGELVGLCANTLEKRKGSSYVCEGGKFYLSINGGEAWEVIVEEAG